MKDTLKPPALLTVKAAAELLACSEDHLRALIREGRLSALNLGTERRPQYRLSLADVLALGRP